MAQEAALPIQQAMEALCPGAQRAVQAEQRAALGAPKA